MNSLNCQACQSTDVVPIFESSNCPRASHKFSREPQATDSRVPIAVYSCRACGVVQLDRPYEEAYADDYQRNTSFSPSALRFMKEHVELIRMAAKPDPDATALEIGCGDGTFLKLLSGHYRVQGVEPSRAAATLARDKGLEIRNEYFESQSIGSQFDVVVLRFVIEHIFEIHRFLEGLRTIVKPGGIVAIEVPNYAKMVEDLRYFEFFREHVLYLDATSLAGLMARHGFRMIRAQPFMNDEYLFGLFELRDSAVEFAGAADRIGRQLSSMLSGMGEVAFWGASGGGVSLLSYSGVPRDTVKYIIDSDPNKHGLFVYGIGAPIVSPDTLRDKDHPAAIIILSPAYEDEIGGTLRNRYGFKGRLGSIRGIPHWID